MLAALLFSNKTVNSFLPKPGLHDMDKIDIVSVMWSNHITFLFSLKINVFFLIIFVTFHLYKLICSFLSFGQVKSLIILRIIVQLHYMFICSYYHYYFNVCSRVSRIENDRSFCKKGQEPLQPHLAVANSLEAHIKSLKSHYRPRITETGRGWEPKRCQSTDTSPVSLFLFHLSSHGDRCNYPSAPGDSRPVTSEHQRQVTDSLLNGTTQSLSQHPDSPCLTFFLCSFLSAVCRWCQDLKR